ncbi:RidA family protein, partial [Candidatus Latescibacterota bacterium]
GFGGALEKEWSHSQGVKTGNMIFIAGQQPYDTNLDENGMPLTDLETGKNFKEQLQTVLGNIKKVLANYGATMDDVVFLQGFVDAEASGNKASFEGAAEIIQEFFPKGLQAMTFIMVDDLYGPEQLIEANAIAVVHE